MSGRSTSTLQSNSSAASKEKLKSAVSAAPEEKQKPPEDRQESPRRKSNISANSEEKQKSTLSASPEEEQKSSVRGVSEEKQKSEVSASPENRQESLRRRSKIASEETQKSAVSTATEEKQKSAEEKQFSLRCKSADDNAFAKPQAKSEGGNLRGKLADEKPECDSEIIGSQRGSKADKESQRKSVNTVSIRRPRTDETQALERSPRLDIANPPKAAKKRRITTTVLYRGWYSDKPGEIPKEKPQSKAVERPKRSMSEGGKSQSKGPTMLISESPEGKSQSKGPTRSISDFPDGKSQSKGPTRSFSESPDGKSLGRVEGRPVRSMTQRSIEAPLGDKKSLSMSQTEESAAMSVTRRREIGGPTVMSMSRKRATEELTIADRSRKDSQSVTTRRAAIEEFTVTEEQQKSPGRKSAPSEEKQKSIVPVRLDIDDPSNSRNVPLEKPKVQTRRATTVLWKHLVSSIANNGKSKNEKESAVLDPRLFMRCKSASAIPNASKAIMSMPQSGKNREIQDEKSHSRTVEGPLKSTTQEPQGGVVGGPTKSKT